MSFLVSLLGHLPNNWIIAARRASYRHPTSMPKVSQSPRLAVIPDYPEEGWPSMDLCAEMLCHHLAADHNSAVRATRICPKFRQRASVLPMIGNRKGARNLDRLLNRFWDYPRYLRRYASIFDFFHICDHSYSQLVHALPSQHTGVFCHDQDAFRCLLEPSLEPRSRWIQWMARSVLNGLRKAAIVFHGTRRIRQQMEKYGLIDPNRFIYAPYGVAPEFTPEGRDEQPENVALAGLDDRPFLLHVGSCIPRKRIDVLLDVFAQVLTRHPDFRLLQVGGTWTEVQRRQINQLQIARSVYQVRGLSRKALASLYRRASLVLQSSEAEGFGLPVLEGLACGAVVVATDLPVLREVGGEAAVYCPLANVPAWTDTVCRLIERSSRAPELSIRLSHAKCYSWSAQARTILTAYQKLVS
jgi:glycosyltransferase involved in cell wall biosynthesis